MATDRPNPLFLLMVLACVVLPAWSPCAASEVCERTSRDGETTISLQVDAPLPGEDLRGFHPDCPDTVIAAGVASTVGLPPFFDVYLLIDSSGSTGACSGADVDEDGTIGEDQALNQCTDPDDSILEAEVEAARDFVSSLSPGASRVAVVEFSDPQYGRVLTRQSLTSDFHLAQRALTRIAAAGPLGTTDFGEALQEVLDEHERNHDSGRNQVVLFLSDGYPTAPTPPFSKTDGDENCVGGYDVCNGLKRADEAADEGILIHSFAVGANADSEVLSMISDRTGGDHHDIEEPGEILEVLPGTSLVGVRQVVVRNLTTFEEVTLNPSPDGRYEVEVGLVEGLNEIEIRATAEDEEGTEVTCLTDVRLVCIRIQCPGDAEAECEGESGTFVGGLVAEASDNEVEIANDSPYDDTPEFGDEDASGAYPLGETGIGFDFTDREAGARACSTKVAVEDTLPPALRCPDPRVEPAGEDCAALLDLEAEADDLCHGPAGVTVTDDGPADGLYRLGTTLVNFRAEDASGNEAACEATVTVDDVTPPEIDCPDDRVEEVGREACEAVMDLESDALDNCQEETGLTVRDDAPDVFGLGVTVVTFTATDGAGLEAACRTTVEVRDVVAPEITCPGDLTLETAPDDETCEVAHDPSAEAEDLCDPEVEPVDDAPDRFPLGPTQVTHRAEDDSGNSSSCSHTVTVVDATPPVLECPGDLVLETGPGDDDCAVPHDPVAAARDNCDPDVGVTDDAPDLFPLGPTQVGFRAEDAAGNGSGCTQGVTVLDTTPPLLDCPGDIILETGPGDDDCAVAYDPVAEARDNCDEAVAVESDKPALFPLGMTVVTFTASDAAGNESVCTQRVTVLDTTPPALDCPDDATLETGPGDDDCLVPHDLHATARDNCDGEVPVESDAPALFGKGVTPVTFTAEDAAGNASSCGRQVTVLDTTPPVLDCPSDVTLETGPGDDDCLVPYDPHATARDNCDGAVPVTDDGPGMYSLGVTTVRYVARDEAGNAAHCGQDVRVMDTTPPRIACPPDVVLETGPDDDDCLVPYDPRATARDNCDPDVLVTDDSPDLFGLGDSRVNFLAEDDSGNTAACSEQVTVIDTTPPRLVFPGGREACLRTSSHRFFCFDSADWVDVWDNCDADAVMGLACLPDPPGDASANQPVDSTGDGAFAPDCVVALDGAHGFCVRAERMGNAAAGGPRLYEIGVTATDAFGNTASDSLSIEVPHDNKDRAACEPADPTTSFGASDRHLPQEYPQFRLPGSPGQRKNGK